jgi:hypothetical protein
LKILVQGGYFSQRWFNKVKIFTKHYFKDRKLVKTICSQNYCFHKNRNGYRKVWWISTGHFWVKSLLFLDFCRPPKKGTICVPLGPTADIREKKVGAESVKNNDNIAPLNFPRYLANNMQLLVDYLRVCCELVSLTSIALTSSAHICLVVLCYLNRSNDIWFLKTEYFFMWIINVFLPDCFLILESGSFLREFVGAG